MLTEYLVLSLELHVLFSFLLFFLYNYLKQAILMTQPPLFLASMHFYSQDIFISSVRSYYRIAQACETYLLGEYHLFFFPSGELSWTGFSTESIADDPEPCDPTGLVKICWNLLFALQTLIVPPPILKVPDCERHLFLLYVYIH